MSRRRLKNEVLQLLAQEKLEDVMVDIQNFSSSELINPLFTALCSITDEVRWHAVSVFGVVVPTIADQNMESARVVMRRFLWMLNDESGGIGWGAPEAMAEIMAMDDRLCNEYLHMLISYMREDGSERFQDGNYIELPTLQRGLLWGIGRLCSIRKELMLENGVADDLPQYLDSEDSVVRGMAVWCLYFLEDSQHFEKIEELRGNLTQIPLYWGGRVHLYTLASFVEQYARMGLAVEASKAK